VAWTLDHGGTTTNEERPPVVIEAKRARLFKVTPRNVKRGVIQLSSVREDAERLADLVGKRDCRGWLLVWGTNEPGKTSSPKVFFHEVNKKVNNEDECKYENRKVVLEGILCRWMPLSWSPDSPSKPMEINRWLWVARVRFNAPEEGIASITVFT
jgi:hypothetical protein